MSINGKCYAGCMAWLGQRLLQASISQESWVRTPLVAKSSRGWGCINKYDYSFSKHFQDLTFLVQHWWLALNPHSIDVTYCAGTSCRYLAVAPVTWGRALRHSVAWAGRAGHREKGGRQPTAEGFIPVHPVGHKEVTSIHSHKITQFNKSS